MNSNNERLKIGSAKGKEIGKLIICIVMLGMLMFVTMIYASIADSLYNERAQYLTTVVTSSANLMNKQIDIDRNYADIVENHINEETDIADIDKYTCHIKDLLNTEGIEVMLVDSDGKYNCSDGTKGRIKDMAYYKDDTADQLVYLSDDNNMLKSKTVLCARNRIKKEITAEGRTICYCAVYQAFSDLEYLAGSNLSMKVNTLLLNINNGNMLYYSYDAGQIYTGTNAFTKIRAGIYMHNANAEDFINSIINGETAVAEFKHPENKERYFECVAKIKDTEWALAYTLPTDNLKGGIKASIYTVAGGIGVSASIAVMVIFMIIGYMKNNNAEKIISYEKEKSELARQVAEAAEGASRAKTNFLSHMSHDIRTPINGIMGMTTIAKKNIDDAEKVSDCLDKIEGASQHLLSLVNDVLDMSRIESGRTVISTKPAYLERVLDNCVSIIKGQIIERELDLITEFDMSRKSLMIDELHIRQIVINILGNAVKFTHDGGKIWVRAKETEIDGKYAVVMEFEDTGIGMKPEFLKHLFEPFTQEDDGSRSNYKGTGLGMAITKQFIELMNGSISVESRYKEGTKFTVTIPFEVSDNLPEEESKTVGDISIEGRHILLVEDNMLNMEIAREMLEDENAIVTPAENGRIAVETFASNAPGTFDIILMDVMMPEMNGYEATVAIRNMIRDDAKTVPIIALTANAFEEDIRKCREAGMNAHLAKPLVFVEMLTTISAYLDMGGNV